MDPLSVLRDFNTLNRLNLVQQVGGNVQFGDRYSFPAATPVYKAAGMQAAAAYYTLQDVLFYLKNRHLKPQEYVMAASQAGVANINIVDRKKVLDVLDGVAAVDPSLLPPLGALPPGVGAAAGGAAGGRALAEGGREAEPQAKRQRLVEDEASAMRGLMAQERQLRNRNTMLLAPNKDFRSVLEAVSNVKKLAAKQPTGGTAAAGAAAGKQQPSAAAAGGKQAHREPHGSSRYGRDSTADQLKAMAPGAGGNLAVNMYGSSSAKPPASSQPPPPASGAAGYVPIRKSGSSAAAAAGAGAGGAAGSNGQPASGSGGRAAKPHAGSGGSKGGGGAAGAGAARAGGDKGGKGGAEAKKGAGGGGGVPIIIVPSGLTSMINMYNARAFLEEGRFVPAAQAQAAAGGAPKPSQLLIRRSAHRPNPPGVEYQLTDRAPPAGSPDWERVVAVVVQGAKWQFKDWPHKGAKDGDLVEALAKVCGFYIHFADEKVGPPVSDWNVRTVPLHRESRHKDMTAMLELYRHLDTFLQAKRSSLSY